MRVNQWIVTAAVGLSAVGAVASAHAQRSRSDRSNADGIEIPLYVSKPGDISINGVLKEWGQPFTNLSMTVQGSGSGCSMQGALAYDDQYLYVAGEVVDRKFVRTAAFGAGEDHAELVLSFPDDSGQYRTVYEVELHAGAAGKSAGQVKARGLGVVSTAQIVEAPTNNGYDFEAKIPWNLFQPAAKVRTGIRGALLYHNSNGGGIAGVIGTVDKISPASGLPLLPIAAEQSLKAGLLTERSITSPPSYDITADVAGEAMKERVMVYDRFLVVLGARYRNGTEYFFSDLGVDPSRGQLPQFEVRDVTGDNKAEIILRKRVGKDSGWREILQVLSFDSSGAPQPVFEHETGISSNVGTIHNDVRVVSGSIRIALGTHTGYTSANYHEPTETSRASLLLPWGTIRSRVFDWDGHTFRAGKEERKSAEDGAAPSAPSAPPPPPAPRPPTSDELLEQVFALYKSERKISGRAQPRFDFVTNVAEDERMERILVHDRDIVVFGKGFKGGRGYAYVTLSQFAESKDIVDVTARDFTGDGLADVVVRGVQRAKAPEELGTGELLREVVFVYIVSPQGISRVFAVETAVSLADKRIQGILSLLAGQQGLDIELRPGRAIGWDRSSWPYKQDVEAVSGIEPIILPWTTRPVRYRFTGNAYTR